MINALAIISLKKLVKLLSPFEVICYWLFISILGHEFFVIVNLNLKLIENTDSKILYLLITLNRTVLIPIIIMWLISTIFKSKTLFKKVASTLQYVLILTAIEYLGDWLGLTNHDKWNIWWTVLEWIGIISLTLLFSLYVKYLSKREVTF